MPLLTKDIEIGRIALENATFNMQVAKNGSSNWQSILTTLDANTSSGTTSPHSSDASDKSSELNIEGFDLRWC